MLTEIKSVKQRGNRSNCFVVTHVPQWSSIPSVCFVSVLPGNPKVVVMTEPKENKGISVTNIVEHLASAIFNHHAFRPLIGEDPRECLWVEHYPPRGKYEERFSIVHLRWTDDGGVWKVANQEPSWEPVMPGEILERLLAVTNQDWKETLRSQ